MLLSFPERNVSVCLFDNVDFCHERRQEVIDTSTAKKYGADHVAQMRYLWHHGCPQCDRDVGRVIWEYRIQEVDVMAAKTGPGE